MPSDRKSSDRDDESAPDTAAQARDDILAALRAARSAAIRSGSDPDTVTADLQERLLRVRGLLADEDASPPDAG